MRVAIHQPNFFPWLGIFHRIAMVDTFIFFDHVQAMRGKSWLSRNKVLLNGEPRWLTMPTKKSGRSYQRVTDVSINYGTNFTRKHLGTLKQAYGKCDYFEEIYHMVEELYGQNHDKLSDFNKAYIRLVSARLGLSATFLSSTELVSKDGSLAELAGNDIILRICLNVRADEYVSGTGCLDFINPGAFEANDIAFYFQKFIHPEYKQNNDSFVSHSSSLDALFNVGFEGTKELIQQEMLDRVVLEETISA